jgi:putative transposase
MKAIIYKIGYDFDMHELQISEEHTHMVIKGEPKTAPNHVMQVIKSIPARVFFKLYPEVKKRYFWGGEFCTKSCSVETIGKPVKR